MKDSDPDVELPGSKSAMFAIVAILGAAILVYLTGSTPRHYSDTPRDFCYQNLRIIQSAKENWAAEHGKPTNSLPTEADLFGLGKYIPNRPSCPRSGNYRLGKISERVRCSTHGEAP